MMPTMGKALLKHKLHLDELTGIERFVVASVTLADHATTFLATTNVEPELVDPGFDYVLLSESVEVNLGLSGLLTTTMLGMENIIKELENRRLRDKVSDHRRGSSIRKVRGADRRGWIRQRRRPGRQISPLAFKDRNGSGEGQLAIG
jgi:hypothetical protein